MSNYSLQVTWSTKDALATGEQLKAVSATELGNEFSAIATAVATKYDSDALASEVEAEALTEPAKLITPLNLDQVFKDNDGILSDLQAITGSAADGLFAWDNGTTTAKLFTLGTGLSFSGDTVALEAGLQAISALAKTDGNIVIGNGSTWVAESGATARTSLGLAIGTNVQAWDADLDAIAGLTSANSNFIVGNGSTWVAENANTARTSLGVGTGDSPQFAAVNLSHATASTLTGASGQALIEGQYILSHDSSNTHSTSSAKVFVSTSAPTTEGDDGDFYYEYTA